ncbi:NAD(P)-dependent alcohol dehydrogenase [Gordonia sp. (in: high G+C Gram-positive bacteria)]|uniref:NAD(P)-dependent alcohol dehydrogenase n=1 Tax=Gordonia sp. (in: high G+C Gram-positive bacteria) TaxID=84139 RepID=UPI00261CCE41|nr:NAD(P)-dependent alcohol dehydrogenase [Gordonia sp. (in: high G+C Gram-positive bacteria)]HMS74694.1 NAD(P)-dependent alcohol dehydrogenase [Gordonia sp. (in: high G+C Gram-positive bacteria)]
MPTPVHAAVLSGVDEPFVFADLVIGDIEPDEVIVKITAVGLCHTDLAVQHGHIPAAFPIVLGHEGSGVIEQIGTAVSGFAVGDAVALSFAACGTCRNCLAGREAYCVNFMALNFGGARENGTTTLADADGNRVSSNFFGQSSFATHAVAQEKNLVKLPAGVPVELVGPLGCGIQTGAGTVLNSLAVPAGGTIAVAGTGAVGLSGIMGAKVAGATTIIAIDILDERLEVAASLGATHTINSKDADPIEKIMEITGGGVDFVLDTTGVAPVIASLIQAAAFGAKIALVGVPRPGSSIDLGLVSATGKTIIGAIEGDAIPQTFIPQMLSLYEAGLFPFDKLITTYPFDQIEQAIADTASGKAVKAVLVMP